MDRIRRQAELAAFYTGHLARLQTADALLPSPEPSIRYLASDKM